MTTSFRKYWRRSCFHGKEFVDNLCHSYCSPALNGNSTAIIIGAMLISPLMDPVMGIELAAGIDDDCQKNKY